MNVLFTSISCLAMVVCLHLPSFPKHWLLDCAMPWFFLASGYWYSRSSKSFGENVRERVRSLIVPYYLWNILWFPILFSVHWFGLRYCGTVTCALFAGACLTQHTWAPEGRFWDGFLVYGLPWIVWVGLGLDGVLFRLCCDGLAHKFILDAIGMIAILSMFVNCPWRMERLGSKLSSLSLGVYLIHPLFAGVVAIIARRYLSVPVDLWGMMTMWFAVLGAAIVIALFMGSIPVVRRFV